MPDEPEEVEETDDETAELREEGKKIANDLLSHVVEDMGADAFCWEVELSGAGPLDGQVMEIIVRPKGTKFPKT